MWNKCLALIKEPATKRLGIALCISALLHFFLAGNFIKLLPDNKPKTQVINARLQLPKPIAKPASVVPTQPPAKPPQKPKKLVKTKSVKAPEPIVEPEPDIESTPTTAPLPIENIPTPAASVSAEPKPNLSEPRANSGEPTPAPADAPVLAEDQNAALNENAYQFAETTFDVSTRIGGSPDGYAIMTYNLFDGTHYQIKSVARANGIAALVLSELLQTSEGLRTQTGLQPNKYTYNYGDKVSKTRLATFNWQTKTVNMQTANGLKTDDLPDDTQDLLSFMYQFMYVPPLNNMHINIVNGKNLRTYDYHFEGEEITKLPIGEVKTIHIQHSNADTDDKIDLWLGIDYQYLPVKILKIDKNGKIIEFTARNLKTSPALPSPPINY